MLRRVIRAAQLSESSVPSFEPLLPFLIVGSDGLWDVLTNQEAVDFVCDKLLVQISSSAHPPSLSSSFSGFGSMQLPAEAMHETAKLLAQEAYVRGSMDNIGVCIVSM